jgi:hypothetical protein
MSVNEVHSQKGKNDTRLLDLVNLQGGKPGSILILRRFDKLKTWWKKSHEIQSCNSISTIDHRRVSCNEIQGFKNQEIGGCE